MAEASPKTIIKSFLAIGFAVGAGLTTQHKLDEIREAEGADLCGFKIGQVFEGVRTGVTCDADEVEALEELHHLELETTPTETEDTVAVQTEGLPSDIADRTDNLVRHLRVGLIIGDGMADIAKNGLGGAVGGLALGIVVVAADKQS